VIQTGAKIQSGGVSKGFFRVAYQVGIAGRVKYDPSPPASSQITMQKTNFGISAAFNSSPQSNNRGRDQFIALEENVGFDRKMKIDDLVKIVIPAQAGIQGICKILKRLVSRFHGNDRKKPYRAFYKAIKIAKGKM
jgi:hypothetical protein